MTGLPNFQTAGWNAFAAGQLRSANPHVGATARQTWFMGWDAASRDSEIRQARKDRAANPVDIDAEWDEAERRILQTDHYRPEDEDEEPDDDGE